MPRGDGAGPYWGSGPGTGRRTGRGNQGAGRMRGTCSGAGPSGECVCPNCGARAPHQAGTPCYNMSCPKCEVKMVRG